MMDIVWFGVNMAWKVLMLAGAWMLFRWLVRDGQDTMRDVLETVSMAIRAGSMALKRKLWEKIKKERSKGTETAEGSVE